MPRRIITRSKQDLVWGPLQKLPQEKPFIVWDVECKPSYEGEPINTAWLGGGRYDGIGKPEIFDSEDEFFCDLLSPVYADHWIYAHNASGYDFHYLLRFLTRRKIPWRGYRTGQRVFISTCGRQFFDSMAILKGSLADIGDELGLHRRKMEVPADFYPRIEHYWRTGFAKEYLGEDLHSLHEGIQITRENFAKLGGILQPTIASTAMTLFRHKYMDHAVQGLPARDPTPDTWRKAYIGGRVEVFKSKMGEGASWDINSSYPASMVDPRGIPCEFLGSFQGDAIPNEPAICQATVTVPEDERHPPLALIGKDSRLYFPSGSRDGWFTSEELEYCAAKYGRKSVAVREIHAFKARPLFDAYVRDLYAIKQKKAGVLSYVAKLAMNSLYGKTGMRRDREQLVCGEEWHSWPWNDPKAIREFEERGETPHKRVISQDDYLFAIPVRANHAPYVMPQIAATVTARGRMRLQALLDRAGDSSCYCDTDSVYAEQRPDFFSSSKDLGALKCETEIARAIFAAPKLYWIKEKACTNKKPHDCGPKCTEKGKAKGVSYRDAAEVLRFIEGSAVRVKRMLGLFESKHRKTITVNGAKVPVPAGSIVSEWQNKRVQQLTMRRDVHGPFSVDHLREREII